MCYIAMYTTMKPILSFCLLLFCLPVLGQQLFGLSPYALEYFDLPANSGNIFTKAVTNNYAIYGVSTADVTGKRYFFVKNAMNATQPDTLICVSLNTVQINKYPIAKSDNDMRVIEYAANKIYIFGIKGYGSYDLLTNTYTALNNTVSAYYVIPGYSAFDDANMRLFTFHFGWSGFIGGNPPDTVYIYHVLSNTVNSIIIPAGKLYELEYSAVHNALYSFNNVGIGKLDLSTQTYSDIFSPEKRGLINGQRPSSFDQTNNTYFYIKYHSSSTVADTLVTINLNNLSLQYTVIPYMDDFEYFPGHVNTPAPEISVNYLNNQLCVFDGSGPSIPFTVNQYFAPNNVFTAQLSDAGGSFANPVNIGSLTSNYSGSINTILPANTPFALGYRIRIISSSPALISADNGIDITIIPKLVISVTTNSPVCEGDTLQVYNTVQQGVHYDWAKNDGKSTFTMLAPIPNIKLSDSGDYVIYATGLPGCNIADTIHIDVIPIPARPVATYRSPLCAGDTLFLSVVAPQPGLDYEWNGVNNFFAQQANAWLPLAGYSAAGKYYVQAINTGCRSDADTVHVTVTPRPAQPILVGDSVLCEGYDLLVNIANKQNNTQYRWYGPNGFADTSDALAIAGIQSKQAGTYHVYNYHNGCPSYDKMINITVKANVRPTFLLPYDGCVGGEVTVERRTGEGVLWYSINLGRPDKADSTFNMYKLVWNTPGRKELSIIAMADNGCLSQPYDDTIHIHNLPQGKILHANWDYACSMDSLLLYTDSATGYAYKWMPETQFLDNDKHSVYAQIFDKANLSLWVTSQWGCTAGDTIGIVTKPCCELVLPTAFTPNGDGRNDVFRVITEGNHVIKKFIVVNRWGQTVYQSADERKGWDGTFNGVLQEVGTYYYFLRYECNNGSSFEKKGEFTLVR
jgi:gliding motility-associated-like protein